MTPSVVATLAGVRFVNSPAPGDVTYLLSTLAGWYDSPPARTLYTALPFSAGSVYSPAYADSRTITLDGQLLTSDRASFVRAQRAITALCSEPSRLYALQVDDEVGSLYCMVQRSSGVLFKTDGVSADFSVSLTAPDPRLLDVTVQSATTPMAQPGGGGVLWGGPAGTTGVLWNGPAGTTGLAWGTPGPSGVVTLNNSAGTAPADITITITGPATNPTVSTSSGYITYGGVLASMDVLVINTGTGSVMLNGANRRSLLTRADFFAIPPLSTMSLSFSADLQNATASMTAAWSTSYY